MLNKHRQSIDFYLDEKTAINNLLTELETESGRFIGLTKLVKCLLSDACKTDRKELIKRLTSFV
jgi:hypothetical protein